MERSDPRLGPLQADLVLEGGGVKGIALVGALTALLDAGYQFNRVAGSSVGALVGSFVAAESPDRLTAEALERLVFPADETDALPGALIDPGPLDQPWLGFLKIPLALTAILRHNGIYAGDALRGWVRDHLPADRPKLTELLEPFPREGHLARDRFIVTVADLTAGTLVHLPDRVNAPDITDVVDAVRASTAIPFVFQPFRSTSGHCYVDGGTLSNFPIDVFDAPAGEEPRFPTFGIRLGASAFRDDAAGNDTASAVDEAKALIDTFTGFYDRGHADQESDRVFTIDTHEVRATDFDIDQRTVHDLYDWGRHAAQDFLGRFDWKDHLARRGVPAVPAGK